MAHLLQNADACPSAGRALHALVSKSGMTLFDVRSVSQLPNCIDVLEWHFWHGTKHPSKAAKKRDAGDGAEGFCGGIEAGCFAVR
jgi:hypothetical protein